MRLAYGATRFASVLLLACTGETPCEKLSVDECSSDERCAAIHGRPLDLAAECVEEPRAAGCQRAERHCGGALTVATHARATPWLFDSTCIPDGWTVVTDSSATVWPECSPSGTAGGAADPMDAGPPLEGMLRETIPGDAGPAECPGPTPWTCELPRLDLSGIGELSVSDVPRPRCPEELPSAGAPCDVPNRVCGYGNRARSDCRAVFRCAAGQWRDESWPCLAAPDGFCPKTPPPIGEPCDVIRFANYGSVPICEYGTTIACYCAGNLLSDPHVWGCNVPPDEEGCTEVPPNVGEGCSTEGLQCTYGGPCKPGGGRWLCRNGTWRAVDDSGICGLEG